MELLTGHQTDRALVVIARALGLDPVDGGTGPDQLTELDGPSWRLLQLNHRPGAGVTGVFALRLRRTPPEAVPHRGLAADETMLCLSTAAVPPGAVVVTVEWNGQEFSGWMWPDDPWLPGLRDGALPHPDLIRTDLFPAEFATNGGVRSVPVAYRPTRRAVFRIESADARPLAYVKVVRTTRITDLVNRHRLLTDAQVPAPKPLAHTRHGAVALSYLPGPTAAARLREDGASVLDPEHVLAVLDRFPDEVLRLPARPSWTDRVTDYARSASTALPDAATTIHWLAAEIETACTAFDDDISDDGPTPVHGDFHPGNILLGPQPVDPALGPITGLLDLDSVGPGRLSDDLACFVAHTWLIADEGRAQPPGAVSMPSAVRRYLEGFDQVVDPDDLRLRVAGVLISLISVAQRRHGKEAAHRRLSLAQAAFRAAQP